MRPVPERSFLSADVQGREKAGCPALESELSILAQKSLVMQSGSASISSCLILPKSPWSPAPGAVSVARSHSRCLELVIRWCWQGEGERLSKKLWPWPEL